MIASDVADEPGDRDGFEPPVSPLTRRAERGRRRVRRRMILWFTFTVLIATAFAAALAFRAIREGRYPILAIVTGLAAAGLIRWALIPARDVWRAESYPSRHWEKTSRDLGCLPLAIAFVGLLMIAAAPLVGGLLIAVEEFSSSTVAGMVAVFFVLLLIVTANVHNLYSYVRVIPYFSGRVGEADTYLGGHDLARHLRELDAMAERLGVAPLSSFGWNDDFHGEPLIWHPPAAGLKTVNALLAHLQGDEFGGMGRAGVVGDLKRIAEALDRADRRDRRFCLILEHGNTTSGAEHDARKGTFF